jgi:CheY-like chemotaxis protein
MHMKTILVADYDTRVRARVKSALEVQGGEFTVVEASHCGEAVAVLAERPVDLVLLDLWMPTMDGFLLLVHLMNQHPAMPLVVLSCRDPWRGLQGSGLEPQVRCLPKPFTVQALLSIVREELKASARWKRSPVMLFSLVQLLVRERKTCALTVGTGTSAGTIHVLNGELVHAKTATHEGEEALVEILSGPEQRLRIQPALPDLRLTIDTRAEWLLAKAVETQIAQAA